MAIAALWFDELAQVTGTYDGQETYELDALEVGTAHDLWSTDQDYDSWNCKNGKQGRG